MRKLKKLSHKISAVIVAGTCLALVTVGFASFAFVRSIMTNQVKQSQLAIAQQTMQAIDRLLYERLVDLEAIAGEDALSAFLLAPGAKNDAVERRINDLTVVTGPWDILFLVDRDGTIVLSTDKEEEGKMIETEPKNRIAYHTAVQKGSYYSDFVISDDTHRPTVIFAAPVTAKVGAKRQPTGVLIGHFSWPVVSHILEDLPLHALLLDREGTVIAHNQSHFRDKLLFKNFKNSRVVREWLGKRFGSVIASKHEGIVGARTLTSFVSQTGYLTYGGSGWGFLVETPLSAAFAPATKTALMLVLLLVPGLILVACVFWILINKMVTDPLAALGETISAITAGNLDQQVPIVSEDEIGKLAASFNVMTSKLKELYERMEEKIAQRTEELRESEEWLTTTLKSIGDGVITTDAGGQINFMNSVAEAMTGWRQSEARGRSLDSVFRIVNEDTRAEVESPAARVIREGVVVGLGNHTLLLSKDGREIPLNDSGAPIRDREGRLVGVVMVFQDVTERRQAERALRESEERSRLIIETAHDAFVGIDQGGKITEWNRRAEEMFGWRRPEALGRLLAETIIPARYRQGHTEGIRKFLQTGEGPVLNKRIEISAVQKNGQEFPVELTVWPIWMGGACRFNAFIHDITDRKRTEALLLEDKKKIEEANRELQANQTILNSAIKEMKHANEELKRAQAQLIQSDRLATIGQLAAGVAHEINNPIGFIASNLSTLERYVEALSRLIRALAPLELAVGKEKNLQKAERCLRELNALKGDLKIESILADIGNLLRESVTGTTRIINIIKDLRTFSHSDVQVCAPENLNRLIQSVVNIVHNEIKYRAELKLEFGELPPVECNGQQIGQVIMNLLVNAAQAIEKKGIVTIRTFASQDGMACVEISDTGKGIPKEILDKIYDPFFTTKEVGKGTGLGLSISYDIVKKHGGTIEVRSEVGKGATFTVVLPFGSKHPHS